MAKSVLSAKHYHDEAAAYRFLEGLIWPDGPVCPHCGGFERNSKMKGQSTRIGMYKCYQCRKPFRVTVGTVFESSHVPLHKWLQAMSFLCSSKKGMSSNQMHRILGVTLKTAWFMTHRLREAMRDGPLAPMGRGGGIVEADETYFGAKDVITTRTRKGKPGLASKRAVISLVERGGSVRSFHVERATKAEVTAMLNQNVSHEARLFTDESRLYGDAKVSEHAAVRHASGEYVRGEVHSNTVENVFSVFKRGMKGVYQHCSEKHLHRYLAEFDFRYNRRVARGINDVQRADMALKGIVGKRLTYETAHSG